MTIAPLQSLSPKHIQKFCQYFCFTRLCTHQLFCVFSDQRNDDDFAFVSTWTYKEGENEHLVKENLNFEEVTPTTRSYK